jgi:hypothetical protein
VKGWRISVVAECNALHPEIRYSFKATHKCGRTWKVTEESEAVSQGRRGYVVKINCPCETQDKSNGSETP